MNDGDPKILPPNAHPIERQIDAAGEARLDLLKVKIRHLWDAATCPAHWLPVLAWSLGVDSWRSDWPEETKRAVIASTPIVKRLKGTVGAVRRAVQAVSGQAPVRIVEWFKPEGSGVPLTARVEIDITSGATARLVQDATRAASNAKRESVHLDLRLTASHQAQLQAASRLRPPVVRAIHGGDALYAPRLPTGLTAVSHIRKPITLGRISMDGAIVRPFQSGTRSAALLNLPLSWARLTVDGSPVRPFQSGTRAAALLNLPLSWARLTVDGRLVRPFQSGVRAASNIRTPAVVARVPASGA